MPRNQKTTTRTRTTKTAYKAARKAPEKKKKTPDLTETAGIYVVRINDFKEAKDFRILDGTIIETIEGEKREGDVALFFNGKRISDGSVFHRWPTYFAFSEALGYEKPWGMFDLPEDHEGEHPKSGTVVQVTIETNDNGYNDVTAVEALSED
jgi:hypothetical protein